MFVEATPEWFDQCLETARIGDLYNAGLDHPRSYQNIVAFSPYKANGEDLLPLLTACNNAGLLVRFAGRSSYDPRAFRIVIFRPQDEGDFHDFEKIDALEMLETLSEASIAVA